MEEKISAVHFPKWLSIGVLLISIFIIALAGISIHQSRLEYEERATTMTQNLSQVLQEYINGVIINIDAALLNVADEAEEQLHMGGIDARTINAYIARHKACVKEVDSLRVSDEKGVVLYGTDVAPSSRINVADRDYFIYLRDHPESGSFISKPMLGRISGKWVIAIARRYNHPDGSFAGVVYMGIILDNLAQAFSMVNVGKRGTITLFDSDLNIICRYTQYQESGSVTGKKLTATELGDLIHSGHASGTYRVRSSVDDIERVFSYRKISSYPLYIVVGSAQDDYLGEWRKDTAKMSSLVALFVLVVLCLALLLHRYFNERKEAEEALNAESRKLKNILDTFPYGVYIVNKQYDIEYLNPVLERELGPSGARKCYSYFHDRTEQCPWCKNDEVFAGKSVQWEWYSTKNKRTYVLFDTPIMNRDGSISKLEVFYDITERKKSEEALKNSELRYRTLVENIPQKIFLKDINSVYISCNNNYALDLNIGPDQIKGMTDYDFYPEELAEKYRADDKRVMEKGEIENFEEKYILNGNEYFVYTIKAPVRDDKGNITGVFGIFHDITEHKQAKEAILKLEEQLRQSQKMESIGLLAGGIAHNINNILGAMMGFTTLLQMQVKEDHPAREILDHLPPLTDRAATLVKDLMAFSRKQVLEMKPASINDIVGIIGKVLSKVIGEDIKLNIRPSAKDIVINADAVQIEQALMNLATNARDAMPEGGVLTISTEFFEMDDNFIQMHGYGKPGRYCMLSVEDTGMGMDEETREKIFEPFFTTKGVGKGTGLGLAMVYGTIKEHDGYINVYSEVGKGTTFRIYLPAIDIGAAEERRDDGFMRGGTETILVVEDESSLRYVTKTMLEKFGYKVIEAEDGNDAVSKFNDRHSEIDLVIMDVIMPNKSGKDAYSEMQKIQPDVKVIFTSGHSGDILTSKRIAEEGLHFILKPISPKELFYVIRHVLDKRND